MVQALSKETERWNCQKGWGLMEKRNSGKP